MASRKVSQQQVSLHIGATTCPDPSTVMSDAYHIHIHVLAPTNDKKGKGMICDACGFCYQCIFPPLQNQKGWRTEFGGRVAVKGIEMWLTARAVSSLSWSLTPSSTALFFSPCACVVMGLAHVGTGS